MIIQGPSGHDDADAGNPVGLVARATKPGYLLLYWLWGLAVGVGCGIAIGILF